MFHEISLAIVKWGLCDIACLTVVNCYPCRFRMQSTVIKYELLTRWTWSNGCKSTTEDGSTACRRLFFYEF